MGNKVSLGPLTDNLDDYITFTYLSKNEIKNLFERFRTIEPELIERNIQYRVPEDEIMEMLPALAHNPFKDRICYVFSSLHDGLFSFEDLLDLCSVMSDNCPEKVKANWAFKLYDFNNDGSINMDDIIEVIDRLTSDKRLAEEDKTDIAEELLKVINIQQNGGITELEFEHAVGKMSEFAQSFRFQF